MDRRPAINDSRTRRHHLVDVTVLQRLRFLDVVRGLALFGVIALNYHAMLNDYEAFAPLEPTFLDRLFNPVSGVLSTRFAATYVFVAGVGVTLMARGVPLADRVAVQRLRMKLLRRGAILLLIGYGLEWIWPGTILFYYGAYFMLASLFVLASTRVLAAASLSAIVAAAGVNLWRVSERFNDNYTAWLEPASPDSPRNVLIRLFVAYTHPVLPWIAFFFAGMIVARGVTRGRLISSRLAACSVAIVVGTYVLRDLFRPSLIIDRSTALRAAVVSLQPFDRGLLYVTSTLGIAILAVWCVEAIVHRLPRSLIVEILARAGRMSLSLYVAHIVVFTLIIDVFDLVDARGLGVALGLSSATYAVGLVAAWFILGWKAHGPIEWLYRRIGGR